MDKLNEAIEQLRQLETHARLLKSEIDDKNKEIRELEKKKPRSKPITDGKSTDRLLAAQLQHSQNQVRLLKSTMEQFLRMGVFNDDLNSSNSITSPTISIEAVVSEFKRGGSRQQRRSGNKSSTNSIVEPFSNRPTKTPIKKPNPLQDEGTEELDTQLRELLREKELLQAEYSKAPSSGGNALVRRRREELESRLDTVDSQMCRIKLKMRSRNIL
ncbi:hypothetical protein BDF21DRAFT_337094 [Thamnidium elegans]|nr:hypothetical protein BDF21DRAFT_337094 [Thamnidium elegans]